MDYWEECIRTAFEQAGIIATREQIESVVADVEGCHENYGTAMGHDVIPNPLEAENERLERELQKERRKTVCPDCGGRGREISRGPYHGSDSECMKCRGEGKV